MSGATTMADRGMRNVIARGDPLDVWQRQSIGRSAQLRLPLRDKVDLRRLAAILRDLANVAEVASSIRTEEDFSALLRFKTAQGVAGGFPTLRRASRARVTRRPHAFSGLYPAVGWQAS